MGGIVVNLPISIVHLWEIFIVSVVLFILMSMIFMFHWGYYGIKGNPRVFIKGIYFTIGILILLTALGLLSIYPIK